MPEQLDCGRRLSGGQRLISLAECLVGVLFVLGHNIWRVLPNEVFLLFGWVCSPCGCETVELTEQVCDVPCRGPGL